MIIEDRIYKNFDNEEEENKQFYLRINYNQEKPQSSMQFQRNRNVKSSLDLKQISGSGKLALQRPVASFYSKNQSRKSSFVATSKPSSMQRLDPVEPNELDNSDLQGVENLEIWKIRRVRDQQQESMPNAPQNKQPRRGAESDQSDPSINYKKIDDIFDDGKEPYKRGRSLSSRFLIEFSKTGQPAGG